MCGILRSIFQEKDCHHKYPLWRRTKVHSHLGNHGNYNRRMDGDLRRDMIVFDMRNFAVQMNSSNIEIMQCFLFETVFKE